MNIITDFINNVLLSHSYWSKKKYYDDCNIKSLEEEKKIIEDKIKRKQLEKEYKKLILKEIELLNSANKNDNINVDKST